MRSLSHPPKRARALPEPTWEIAQLFPMQGNWSEADYLELNGNHLLEFSHGRLEVLPMPTTTHQLIVCHLYALLDAFLTVAALGTVVVAPLRVRLWRGKFREPDVVVMLREHADRIGDQFWQGADLVMEVVSSDPDDRRRDLETKRHEYARAGIAEYWIVDPHDEQITVLRLARKQYVEHGKFGLGDRAVSHLLPGFAVDVGQALAPKSAIAIKPRKIKDHRRSPKQ